MISQQLVGELKTILKDDFGLDLKNQDVEAVGNQLVASYEVLIKLYLSKKQKIC
ncbi:hypothetical protein KAJ89_04390 [Candidatus Parcubacteria bacterium]|nr:hypothetical protein [Candidatus Parcubacteria bacterium]